MTLRRAYFFVLLLCLPVLVLTACDRGDTQGQAEVIPGGADDHAGHNHAPGEHPHGDDPAQAANQAFISGTIVETMDSGGYSYVLLDTGSSRVWVAGPVTTGLEVGQKVSSPDGMEMKNFTAKSLDKTFESIFFVGGIVPEGAETAAASPHGGMGMNMGGSPAASSNTKLDKAEVTGVEKLAGGYTVEEIYSQAAQLGGQTVKLRGQVVKFTANIMGTNWVHIQDGTGTAETSDLTVTTAATLAAGDLVVVEGPLSVDKDFGAGYKYHVIVEGATVTKQ
jgi:hypothetical protein